MKYKWYDQNDTSHLLGKLCFIGFLLHFKNKEYEWYNPNGTETYAIADAMMLKFCQWGKMA